MSQRLRRFTCVAGVATALVVAFAAPAQAATYWHVAVRIAPTTSTPVVQIADVATASSHSVWAVGSLTIDRGNGESDVPLVEHWNGRSWHRFTAPAIPAGARVGAALNEVVASSHGLWVVGSADFGPSDEDGSFVARWTGTRWSEHNFGENWNVAHLAVLSSKDVRVLGVRFTTTQRGVTAHWNGQVWTTGSLAERPAYEIDGELGQVAPTWAPASSPTTYQPLLLHWNGHAWARATMPKVALPKGAGSYFVRDVLDLGHGDVWLTVGYAHNDGIAPGLTLYHLTKTGWHRTLNLADDAPAALVSDGGKGLWLLSAGLRTNQLLHVLDNGTKVTWRVNPPTSGKAKLQINAISLRGRSVLAVGDFFSKTDVAAIARFTP
jgi:hypothetical protein